MDAIDQRVEKLEKENVKLFGCVDELKREFQEQSRKQRESDERQNRLMEGLCEQQKETNQTLKAVAEILVAWNSAKGLASFLKWLSSGAKTIIPIITIIVMILAFIKFVVLA